MKKRWTLEDFNELSTGKNPGATLAEAGITKEELTKLVLFGYTSILAMNRDQNHAAMVLGIAMFALGMEVQKRVSETQEEEIVI